MMAVTAEPLPKLDFTEALKDSPRFRHMIGAHEAYFGRLDGKLNELVRLMSTMAEHGKHYVNTLYTLSVLVNQICAESLPQDPTTVSTLKSLSDAYSHVVYLNKVLVENTSAVMCTNINTFVKGELSKVGETRAQFESLSTSLDEALIRKASVAKARGVEISDARNALTAVGTCFAHTALDYVAQINIAQAHKDHVILDAMWSFVKECSVFFSKGHAFFDEWTAIENGSISDTVANLVTKGKTVERKMQDRHSLVPKEVFLHPAGMSPEDDVVMEGYLFKRATNAFKTWHRRWFQIKDNRLLYSHRSVDMETPTVMEADLKLCLVRPAPANVERTCCFELVTPTKNHLLQADSETLCTAWMKALQRTIHHLHENDDTLPPCRTLTAVFNEDTVGNTVGTSKDSLLAELRRIPGNDTCADCGASAPKWASINLGVLLCIECCGIHRSFGVQVSKVRSLTMDSLESEQRKLMMALGNNRVNSVYLAHLPSSDIVPPQPKSKSSRPVREAWIRAKYVEKRFARLDTERTRSSANVRAERLLRKTSKAQSPQRSISDQELYGNHHGGLGGSECPPANANTTSQSRPLSAGGTPITKWNSTPLLEGDVVVPSKVNGDSKRILSCGSENELEESLDVQSTIPCGDRVLKAASSGDILELSRFIAEGVDIHVSYDKTTALHTAIKHNQCMAAEFLLLNGSKVNSLDASLNSPLHIAAANAHTLIVCQLMKRGADQRLRNCSGESALDMAVEGEHADIVTLLRLQEMRDEFSEEFNNPMDETVDDVIMDISRRVDPSLR